MKKRPSPGMLALVVVFLLAVPATAHADVGPKPELTIVVQNPPEGEYYLDLLVQGEGSYDNIPDKRSGYDPVKLSVLEAYAENGWHPALTQGTRVPMWGSLTGVKDGNTVVHTFGYVGVPDDYRIIVVTPDSRVIVSEAVHRNTLQSKVTYDYETGIITQPSLGLSYLTQFLTTVIPTLITEGIILYLFGFSLRDNWKAFLAVNLATQVLLTATLGTAMLKGGILLAYLTFVPIELIILLIEIAAFSRLLRQHNRNRRIGYAITANVASAVAGGLLMWFQSMP